MELANTQCLGCSIVQAADSSRVGQSVNKSINLKKKKNYIDKLKATNTTTCFVCVK